MLTSVLTSVLPVTLGYLTAGVAVVNWWSVANGRLRAEWWSKLLTLALLAATAAALGAGSTPAGRWLLVALAFGWLGDLALLGSSRGRFLAGVAAFLVGHLAYLVCFATLGLPWPVWSWLGVLVLLAVMVATREVLPGAWRTGGSALGGPLAAYNLVIGGMLLLAWGTGLPLVAAGATVFVVSDALIGLGLVRHGFERRRGVDGPAVMVTYHLGQALIVAGVLL